MSRIEELGLEVSRLRERLQLSERLLEVLVGVCPVCRSAVHLSLTSVGPRLQCVNCKEIVVATLTAPGKRAKI